jgi:hypothetical protein
MSFAKIPFMKKFVAALTALPDNWTPNLAYEPLLKDPSQPLVCRDCHTDPSLNIEGMLQNAPGDDEVQPLRRQPAFMVALMEKWVQRLNERHKDKLRKEVTCTDCHSSDPRKEGYIADRLRVYPPLMTSFVEALSRPPSNRNPAKGWKPLLKDPKAGPVDCSTCHGTVGANLMRGIASGQIPLEEPEDFAAHKGFMVGLMEKWVERLNREAGDQLTKAVTCLDCHDTDPRR